MEKLVTAEEVANILNVSAAWVYDHADRKRPVVPSMQFRRQQGTEVPLVKSK